ncbi:hypothetical protein GCM10027406_26080 [Leifsonia lichenia]
MERAPFNLRLAGIVALLLVRSVLLWVLVPIAGVVWVFGGPALWRRGSMRRFVRWVDYNSTAALCRTVLRPFARKPHPEWAPPRTIRTFQNPISFTLEFA